jgi:hypothetical protein
MSKLSRAKLLRTPALVSASMVILSTLFVGTAHAADGGNTLEKGFWCLGTVGKCNTLTGPVPHLGVDPDSIQPGFTEVTGDEDTEATAGDETGTTEATRSGDGHLTGPYSWHLGPIYREYAYCYAPGLCERKGEVRFGANINLSGRGTGSLFMYIDRVSGPSIFVTFYNRCNEKPVGSCGYRIWGSRRSDYVGWEIDFAKEGHGYYLKDAANYDITFTWMWRPDGVEPPGWVGTDYFDSYDFQCPTRNRDCYFPDW